MGKQYVTQIEGAYRISDARVSLDSKERPILLPSANVCSKRIASCIRS
jgi:hypothetical protein